MKRSTQSGDPRCWWCGISTPAETGYRGSPTDIELPPGAGVVVCTPACPQRPEGAIVWATAQHRRDHPARKPARRRSRATT